MAREPRHDDKRSGGPRSGGSRSGGNRWDREGDSSRGSRRSDDAPRGRGGRGSGDTERERHGFGRRGERQGPVPNDRTGYGDRSRSGEGSQGSGSGGALRGGGGPGGRRGRDGEVREFVRRGENRDRGGFRGTRDDERSDRDGRGRGGRGAGRDSVRGGRPDRGRDSRPPQHARVPEPPVPEDVTPQDLEGEARSGLRALGRQNAESVARHLVMVQRLLDTDPEAAHSHARFAASHAGRIAVVRETAAIAAYLAGHYAEALRDLRAARRLSGAPELHRAIEVDCERGLGRPDQALRLAEEADASLMDEIERAELAMVVSGLRDEIGQPELGLIVIEDAIRARLGDRETRRRLHSVRADRLETLGRTAEAEAVRLRIGPDPEEEDEEEIEVFDIEEESRPETVESRPETAESGPETAADTSGTAEDSPQDVADPVEQEATTAGFDARVEAEMTELLDAPEVGSSPCDETAAPPAPTDAVVPTHPTDEEAQQ